MQVFKSFLSISLFLVGLTACTPTNYSLLSPDGMTQIGFSLNDETPTLSVTQDATPILSPSVLGLQIIRADAPEDTILLSDGFRMLKSDESYFLDTWATVWGEEDSIRNEYSARVVHLEHVATGILLDIEMRAYNDGVAWRYVFPEQAKLDSFVVLDERTSYTFADTTTQAWSIPWRTEYYEALWTREPVLSKDSMCSPITLQWADGRYGFLHEANLTDYPAQNFYVRDGSLRTYLTPWLDAEGQELDARAYCRAPFSTPWRMMVLARSLDELCASRLILNLNEPCTFETTDWIHPMKFIGIWWGMHLGQMTWRQSPTHGATTANMMRYLDFAADHGFGGVLAEGWNTGWEGYEGVRPDERFSFVTPYPDYDIDSLAQHAARRGVEIICHHETSGQAGQYQTEMEQAYDYMNRYGITSVKTGYVAPIITTVDGKQYNRSQSGVRHYRQVIETAARYHVCIDNHEPVMPTGLCRTYPNLMTQEGIRGQEWNAWAADGGSPASHVCTLPFTRMLAGSADYTPGVFCFDNPLHPGTRVHGTLMQQLALFVTMYSPLQMACDLPEYYERYPEAFRFVEDVPCDWAKSRLLAGEIGEYVVMARQDRHSDKWFIGATTNEQDRQLDIPLDMLVEGQTYTAYFWHDAEETDWQAAPYAFAVDTLTLTSADLLHLNLHGSSGAAIELVPNP